MKLKISIFIVAVVGLSACINEPEIPSNTNKGNFEALWTIIDTRYCYLEYKKINWDSIHAVYEPRVLNSMDKVAFFDLMGEMLAELKDGHVNLYSDFNTSRYWKWYTDYPDNFSAKLLTKSRYLGSNYMSVSGLRYNRIANNKVGYIYYPDFSVSFSDVHMYNVLTTFSNCDALIIDVRNNGGGLLSMAEQFASYFFKAETITGYMQHKTGNGHADFSKPEALRTPSHSKIQWERPVVVLANRRSYSSTNSFISRMKQAPNVQILGDTSGGGGGLPLSSELPNGWMVRFSSSPMFDAKMQHTEFGVVPDVAVALLESDENAGIDTLIEAAISLLISK